MTENHRSFVKNCQQAMFKQGRRELNTNKLRLSPSRSNTPENITRTLLTVDRSKKDEDATKLYRRKQMQMIQELYATPVSRLSKYLSVDKTKAVDPETII